MPEYKYVAKDGSGRKVTGNLTAVNEADAVGELRRQSLIVVSLNEKKAGAAKGGGLFGSKTPKPRVKTKDIVVFTRQLATMISSGIPLLEALEILSEQADDPGFKMSLSAIVDRISSGTDLSEALTEHPKLFSNIYVNMIKAGEASGQLDEILNRLASYQESAEKLKSEIKSAMTYPTVSLVLIILILVALLLFVIPQFKEIFKSLGAEDELPMPTQLLLGFSDFTKANWFIWLPAAIVAVVLLIMFKKTEKGSWVFDVVKLKLPIFGVLFQKVAISRFSKTFATLLKSGVPILAALDIVAATSGNRVLEKSIRDASESVRQGETLGAPLANCPVFPPMVTRMIAIGEKSGSLENLLEKISEFYDNEVSATVDSLTSLIEPIMITAMGVIVGGVVLAVFLPIFSLSQQVGKK